MRKGCFLGVLCLMGLLWPAVLRAATARKHYFAHDAVEDRNGVIAPWYNGQNGQFDLRVRIAAETLKRQLREAKERRTVSKGRAARRGGAAVAGPVREEIVPRRLVAKPMSVDEAKMQLDAGREQFLVFRNAQSGEVNVLYRRRDGGLGLIEPVA